MHSELAAAPPLHLLGPRASVLTTLLAPFRDGAELGAMESARDAGLEVGGYTHELGAAPEWLRPHLLERGNRGEALRSSVGSAQAVLLLSFGEAAPMIRECKQASPAGFVRHLRLGYAGRRIPDGLDEHLAAWIGSGGIETLCVVGTAELREPGIRAVARKVIAAVLEACARSLPKSTAERL